MRTSALALSLAAAAGCSAPSPEHVDAAPVIDAPVDSRSPIDARVIDAPAVDAPVQTGSNQGFPIPTGVTKANVDQGGNWVEVGDADWSCLGTPSPDQPSTQNIVLSGKVRDFQNANTLGNATITAFPGTMVGGNLGTATSDAAVATRGNYALTVAQLPAGQRRVGFKLEALNYTRTYILDQYLPPAMASQSRDLSAVSTATTNALTAFVGLNYDSTTGTVVGTFRDCAGHTVSNAVATVSAAAATVQHLAGVDTFYFSDTNLPTRHNIQPTMGKNGLFFVIDVAPQAADAYIQIWGFRNAGELAAGTMTLLSVLPSPIEANTIISAPFEARRQ